VAEGCKRLIKNAIVCWNYLYLTRKIAEAPDAETRKALLESVTAGSAISWHHINLLGEYDFSNEKLRDSVGIRPPSRSSFRPRELGKGEYPGRRHPSRT
jgi:hypothetical protein